MCSGSSNTPPGCADWPAQTGPAGLLLCRILMGGDKRFWKYDVFSLTLPSPAGRGNAFGRRGEVERIRLDDVVASEQGFYRAASLPALQIQITCLVYAAAKFKLIPC
jgi:hypothetical protein